MKCIIVDDEPIARRGMRRLAAGARPELEIAGEFGDAESAGAYLSANPVDLVFLDIRMPGADGIEFARTIPGNTMVIFTTAYSEYAVESYEVEAIDYLLKPIDPARFDKAVDKAAAYLDLINSARIATPAAAGDGTITVKADRRYHRINTDEIRYIEGLKDYVVFHLEGRRTVVRATIKETLGMLPSDKFLRVSKSHIVNVRRIESFDRESLSVEGSVVPIGASFRDEALARLLG